MLKILEREAGNSPNIDYEDILDRLKKYVLDAQTQENLEVDDIIDLNFQSTQIHPAHMMFLRAEEPASDCSEERMSLSCEIEHIFNAEFLEKWMKKYAENKGGMFQKLVRKLINGTHSVHKESESGSVAETEFLLYLKDDSPVNADLRAVCIDYIKSLSSKEEKKKKHKNVYLKLKEFKHWQDGEKTIYARLRHIMLQDAAVFEAYMDSKMPFDFSGLMYRNTLHIFESEYMMCRYCNYNWSLLKYIISPRLRDKKSVFRCHVRKYWKHLHKGTDRLRDDYEVVRDAVLANGKA